MKDKKGFTLVELLAVIVILGVLLLVAVPAVSTVITNSRKGADRDEAIEFLNAISNCSLASGNTSVCSVAETTEYLNGTEGIQANYQASVSGDKITFESFWFKGKNGYVVYSANASSSNPVDLNALKAAINAAGNAGYADANSQPSQITDTTLTGVKGYKGV